MEYIQALIDMQIVPASMWPVIGTWTMYALAALCAVNGALWYLDFEDMKDGRRDLPWVPAWRSYLVTALSFVQALLEMLPVQLPFVRGIQRLRDIQRARENSDNGLR